MKEFFGKRKWRPNQTQRKEREGERRGWACPALTDDQLFMPIIIQMVI